jgi:hypothetical protein
MALVRTALMPQTCKILDLLPKEKSLSDINKIKKGEK